MTDKRVLQIVHHRRGHLVAEALQLGELFVASRERSMALAQRQQRGDAHAELDAIERVAEEVVDADAVAEQLGRLIAQGRDHDDRQELARALLLDAARGFEAVHARQHGVHEHDVGGDGRRQLDGLFPIGRFDGVVAGVVQIDAEQLAGVDIVVDDQDLVGHSAYF